MDGTAGRHVKRNKPVSKITSFFFSHMQNIALKKDVNIEEEPAGG
jgi:hypothetical protein